MKNHVFSETKRGLNLVAIGGGNGLSTLLSGLKHYVAARDRERLWLERLSAIVAVSDDGGSSGRLRDELQILPPGDIRNCMVALSEDSHLLSRLFQHRFRGDGELGGHSFGNLFLAALSEITGDFAEAVRISSEILASKGQIFPATVSDVRLVAELENGTIIRGESNLAKAGQKIKRLRLEPEKCHPLPETLAAISEADVLTVGPGSLYTSLIPPLLVSGLPQAIAKTNAVKIFICNLMTQPGETDGFSARRHLETIGEYAPEIEFDFIVVNTRPVTTEQAVRYRSEGAEQIGVHGSISPQTVRGADLVFGDLLEEGPKVRHDPAKLARVILLCASATKKNLAPELIAT